MSAWFPEPTPTRLRWPLAHLEEMIAKQLADRKELAAALDHKEADAAVERRFQLGAQPV